MSDAREIPDAMAAKARRLKSFTILAVVLWSALVFLAWSQPWFSLTASGRAGDSLTISVQGSIAGPALSALALAGLALSAALAIAGTVVRAVLGFLELVLGASIAFSSISALADPAGASQAAVTTATGVAGSGSIKAIVSAASPTLWPYLAVVVGVLMALTGILIMVSLRRWPVSGRRYQPVQFAAADGRTSSNPADLLEPDDDKADDETEPANPVDPDEVAISSKNAAVDNWDSLTRGTDPTS
ncbi:Trp biosynthesis-associated membrane protein [Subtercola sp. RTI3]|nr:Trp biosynthesis-associated membrane protein [Subtercola sp. RTI3]MEA9986316.1 Trp biosynthesis-associated membrane protein [Subtercola sp. RTI3]